MSIHFPEVARNKAQGYNVLHNLYQGKTMDKDDKQKFTIFVNNNEFHTDKHELTGATIKALGGAPADYELFEVQGDHTISIGNEQVVTIHNNMHFRAIPAGTFGLLWRCRQN